MKVGLQLYSIKDIEEKQGLPMALKAAAVCGYEGVEFAGFFGLTADEINRELQANNLSVCGAHISYEQLTEDYDNMIDMVKKLNAYSVCVPWKKFDTAEEWDDFGKKMNELGKKLAAEGIKFGYHNHVHEYIEYDGKFAIDRLLDNCDGKNVFFELDTRHTALAKVNPVDYAEKYAGRIPVLHARDTDMTNDVAVGSGVVDFEKVVKCADGIEWLVVENENFGSNLEELRKSAEYLKKTFC